MNFLNCAYRDIPWADISGATMKTCNLDIDISEDSFEMFCLLCDDRHKWKDNDAFLFHQDSFPYDKELCDLQLSYSLISQSTHCFASGCWSYLSVTITKAVPVYTRF